MARIPDFGFQPLSLANTLNPTTATEEDEDENVDLNFLSPLSSQEEPLMPGKTVQFNLSQPSYPCVLICSSDRKSAT